MSVINSGLKRKDYSDHSSYSYSGIGPKKCTPSFTSEYELKKKREHWFNIERLIHFQRH